MRPLKSDQCSHETLTVLMKKAEQKFRTSGGDFLVKILYMQVPKEFKQSL